jgi:hypothetical protein
MFAMHFPEDGRFEEMLQDLTTSVLRHAGYKGRAATALAAEISAGVANGCRPGSAYDVEFRAHAGELVLVVSQGGRRIFHTSRRLP